MAEGGAQVDGTFYHVHRILLLGLSTKSGREKKIECERERRVRREGGTIYIPATGHLEAY